MSAKELIPPASFKVVSSARVVFELRCQSGTWQLFFSSTDTRKSRQPNLSIREHTEEIAILWPSWRQFILRNTAQLDGRYLRSFFDSQDNRVWSPARNKELRVLRFSRWFSENYFATTIHTATIMKRPHSGIKWVGNFLFSPTVGPLWPSISGILPLLDKMYFGSAKTL